MNTKELYLDYLNNFISIKAYADHHRITERKARNLIEIGRAEHHAQFVRTIIISQAGRERRIQAISKNDSVDYVTLPHCALRLSTKLFLYAQGCYERIEKASAKVIEANLLALPHELIMRKNGYEVRRVSA